VAEVRVVYGCVENRLSEEYAEYAADAVNWEPQVGSLSLAEGRRGFNRTIAGGSDQNGASIHGSQKDVSAEVLKAIEGMGTRGFMLGAGCALAQPVPARRLSWVRQTVVYLR